MLQYLQFGFALPCIKPKNPSFEYPTISECPAYCRRMCLPVVKV